MGTRRGRGNGGFELSFDGLADSVTNLVGALILLVLLIIGVTREAVSQTPEPPPQTGDGEADADGNVSLSPLTNRAEFLRSQLRTVEQEISDLDGSLEQLRGEVDELLERVESAQPPQPAADPEPKEPEDRKQVYYRPPKLQETTKSPDLIIICENGRVSVADLVAINAEAKRRGAISASTVIVPSSGDFDYKIDVLNLGVFISATEELVRKERRLGESVDAALRPDSEYRRALQRTDAENAYLQFAVYPDSHETFRAAREAAWDADFDLNWLPMSTGETIGVGSGLSEVQ